MQPKNALRLFASLVLASVSAVSTAQVRPCPPQSLSVDGQGAVLISCTQTTTLSQEYPGDIGIGTDVDVIWTESFDQGSLSAITSRYDEARNSAGMTLSSDTPADSSGSSSLRMQSSSSGTNATHLFKNLINGSGGDDEWYVRYYVKYGSGGTFHHTGVWAGGYNPALSYPNPQAGTRPNGDDRFSIAIEPTSSGSNLQIDFYNYWMQMHSWMENPSGSGAYYGNTILHDTSATVPADGWTCMELQVKLNSDPASAQGGELALWLDDTLVQRYNETGPLGYWVRDKFCPNASTDTTCTAYYTPGTPLVPLDLQFRSTNSLKLNYLWMQNYITSGGVGNVWYDDVVVAKRRIGCIR